MEVTLPAFSEDMGSRAWAGVLLSVWSFGSATGGIIYGARAGRCRSRAPTSCSRRSCRSTFLPLALAPSIWVMPALCLVAGVAIAPLLASGNQLVVDVAPAGALTEAYTWPITALVIGLALGNAVAGVLVEARTGGSRSSSARGSRCSAACSRSRGARRWAAPRPARPTRAGGR